MENQLKHVSKGVIEELNRNQIKTIMATGDNLLTAISVALQCSIIDENLKIFYADLKNDKIVWDVQGDCTIDDFKQPQLPNPFSGRVQAASDEELVRRPSVL